MSQVYNPQTKLFVKLDNDGKFTSSKSTPYKNVELKVSHTKHADKTSKPKNNRRKKDE